MREPKRYLDSSVADLGRFLPSPKQSTALVHTPSNFVKYAEKSLRTTVLAKPFPETVDQGFILAFAIQFSELESGELGMPTQITNLGAPAVRFQLAAIFAAVACYVTLNLRERR